MTTLSRFYPAFSPGFHQTPYANSVKCVLSNGQMPLIGPIRGIHVAQFLFTLCIIIVYYISFQTTKHESCILNWYVPLSLLSCSLPLSVLPLTLYFKQLFPLSFYKCKSYLLRANLVKLRPNFPNKFYTIVIPDKQPSTAQRSGECDS